MKLEEKEKKNIHTQRHTIFIITKRKKEEEEELNHRIKFGVGCKKGMYTDKCLSVC